MSIVETNEAERSLAKGSDGKAYDVHQVVVPETEGGPEKTEWLLSSGIKLATSDGSSFTVPGEDLVLTKVGG
ncbi:hypothetical protein GTW51_20235 [Aurantimonas aggregata]|uniref:Uncharacterized protein n=1 Tax=Aurantimonas aggregata TaxID=2047720 RepID=A0A6L9MMC7_9HYPH|nr:hypothetical protein [Aurantimonas aggregata]NDV89009.1 hypothetical protein [Aurantimonas aggregata]